MAKKEKKTQVATDEPIVLDVQLSKGEAWIEKNWKAITAAIVALIAVVLGLYFYRNYQADREAKAQEAIAAAQTAFASQQFEQALNGDGNSKGFLKVIDEFSGTETANLAKLYAGLAYAKIDKVDEAIKCLEGFSGKDDQIISPSAMGALANCYIQKGETEKGAALLVNAAEKANNDAVSPVFLLQAGKVYESLNNNEKAAELYGKIKKQYFRSIIAQDIDKYIERVAK